MPPTPRRTGATVEAVRTKIVDKGARRGTRLGVTRTQSSRLKVLVTDGDYKHALAIVRSLGRSGHKVTVLASSPNDIAARSRYCAAVERISGANPRDSATEVLQILRRNPHDLVIPVGYATTLALARVRRELLPLALLETPQLEKICFAADKERVREFGASLGIPVPATLYPQSKETLESCASRLGYPLVLKVRKESAGITVRIVKTRQELFPAYNSLMSDSCQAIDAPPMIQEYVPGYRCGFFALYQDGGCKRIFMHRRIRENPPVWGISSCAESFYDPTLKELSVRLLDALQWHGVAMVEFRYDQRDRQYKLLEINPKFWGSLDLALAAGADFPGDLCRMATGVELAYSEEYQRKLRYHWLLFGDLQHALSNPVSIGSVLADCFNPRVKSKLWLSDLGPNFAEMRSLLQSGWRRMRQA
jgi:predicted ATP-grasp superfamily ATP-dependent carboligase